MPPSKNTDFDRAYRSGIFHWMWTDLRVPEELKVLVRQVSPETALEFGCGVGRFSDYLAQRGVRATGVDFSEVAIEKARRRVRHNPLRPEFLVGDVTSLDALAGPFDLSFDVGCFHCLDPEARPGYFSEVVRLLKPGGTHLIWAMDTTPSGRPLSPETVRRISTPGLVLADARKSRRRLAFVASHWYWLVRSGA